jgi:hypothetical protein
MVQVFKDGEAGLVGNQKYDVHGVINAARACRKVAARTSNTGA